MSRTTWSNRPFLIVAFLLVWTWTSGPVLADTAPDLEVNPVTGAVEAVEISPEDGGLVRHVEDDTQTGVVLQTVVSAEPAADSQIAIKETGESWAVWEEAATAEIRYAYRDPLTKIWSAETTVSGTGEASHAPRIVHNGLETWVAYEIETGSSTSIAVTGIIDSPEPFPPAVTIATRTFAASAELDLRAESGRVWVSWLESETELGWSEYDPSTGEWTSPRLETYAGSTVATAKDGVRRLVLGQ
jgi:hypothetical protein